jgi:myo-inositol-hexaphosphate 3-phosphohydrolase
MKFAGWKSVIFFSLFCTALLTVINPVFAVVPVFATDRETTPIPAGIHDTDDPAIWLHPTSPESSLVIGVSKNKLKTGGQAGIGIYNLQGELVKYILHDRLNNVDLRYNIASGQKAIDLAVASNRDKKALSLFAVSDNDIRHIQDIVLRAGNNKMLTEEPYGLCLGQNRNNGRLYAFSPMKSGLIYQHAIYYSNGQFHLDHIRTIDTARYLTRPVDQHLITITVNDAVWQSALGKNELIAEINEELRDRFQLEGCVVDDAKNTLYYGMENLGVFKFNLNARNNEHPVLIAKVARARSEPGSDSIAEGTPRVINDVEGLALLHGPCGQGALIVSVQGLDEYALFDKQTDRYIGSFKLVHGAGDPVTETDGLDTIGSYLGPAYPHGLLVVHDHVNTDSDQQILNANYKLKGLDEILDFFPALGVEGFQYDPRKAMDWPAPCWSQHNYRGVRHHLFAVHR